MKQSERRRLQTIKRLRPRWIARQQHINGDSEIRPCSAAAAIAIELIHDHRRPTQTLRQMLQGPSPQLGQADLMRGRKRLKSTETGRPDPGTTSPEPTPPTPQNN